MIVRRATDADRPAVLELMRLSLGWQPQDPDAELFAWKHVDNTYGASPAWVAEEDGQVVGFRTFLRWEFVEDGAVRRAVRAVDTATHPDHRGKGIFKRLTLGALDDLAAEGVDFVFNTPNDQSRPGYLTMGWEPVGTLPVVVRPRGPVAVARMARARVPAELWSEASDAGRPATEVLDGPGVDALLAAQPSVDGLVTRRSVASLRWRYGFAPLHYRALVGGASAADGLVVFRLRRRGPARECAVTEVLVPPDRPARATALVRAALRASGADYAVALGSQPTPVRGLLRLPGQGPLLVWRRVGAQQRPPLPRWRLGLGDVELF